ncbi:MAG: DisA protein [Desulfobacterales bacterium]|nr:DisA protein [Desulfobacterales bacterium]
MKNLLPFFSTIRWQDIFDIALNSYILFRFYILFRGTRVFRMLIVIAFLWFFHRIAVSFGIIVTSLAIQGIIAVGAFIVIVVFSNEIRSVFQGKNLRAILWGFPEKKTYTPVEIIADSVFEMSEKYCGALMVFPGKDDIKDFVQNGVRWNGLISKQMILSIFWENNPVHDGAAVIRGDQVEETGAILPLSKRKDLPFYYGTRHRAAAGVTEKTDALVVLVSEERGSVIIAEGTDMSVMQTREELEQKLLKHVGASAKNKRCYLIKKFIGQCMAAFFSVLFIIITWFIVARGLNTLITLEVPLEYMNRDPAMDILDTSADSVRLHISGSDVLIKSIRPERIRAKIDMGKAAPGFNAFPITDENITLPPGILLTKVDPEVIEIDVDVPIIKELPVQVDWVGKLDKSHILEHVRIYPEKIRLSGNSRILNDISTIYTEKISVGKIKQSGKITVSLALNPATLKTAPGSPDRVTVEFVVKERLSKNGTR